MKVVDGSSCKIESAKDLKVLVGINDQEFNLIKKSLQSRHSVKGRFMSPLVALCTQNKLDCDWIGRKLVATSNRLSSVSFKNPLQFYRLGFILIVKSWSLLRTPQALPFLLKSVPAYVEGYLKEGSECMFLKIQNHLRMPQYQRIIAIVPMENFSTVVTSLESIDNVNALDESRIHTLDSEKGGKWVLLVCLYVLLPLSSVIGIAKLLYGSKLKDLSNYETQGIALGTWVRDRRRD